MEFLLLAGVIAVADQLTKKIVNSKIQLGQYVTIVKDRVFLTNLRNRGAAYGFLKDYPKLLSIMTAISCAGILQKFYIVFKTGKLDTAYKFSLACIIGGAVGNIIDRVRLRYVTDFIYIKLGKKAPVFNIADFFVLLGAIVFVVKRLRNKS